MKNVVDSSGWIEWFADGPNASVFEPVLTESANVIVPTIVLFEVQRIATRRFAMDDALELILTMQRCVVADLTAPIALYAAHASPSRKLAMADAIIYATALHHDATLWTQDAHFEDLPSVRYFPKVAGAD
jgi:toxin FitB